MCISSVWNAGRQKQNQSLLSKHSRPQISLSRVCQPESHLSKSGYSEPSIHSESGHQPPRMSPRSPLLFFLLPSRCLTRRWTGGCAGVSIDPKWQVASEFVAWRQWLGRLDREGQLNLRQTRDKPNPVPTNHDWGEVSACSVLWNDLFMRKCSSQHLTCMKCVFNWQRAGKRHSTDRRDKNWEEVSNPGICWNEILCMCLKPTDPLESQEILPSQSTVNTPLLCQKQNKKGKQHVCCLSEKFLYPYSNAFQLICSCKSLC